MKDSINIIRKGLNEIHKFDNRILFISLMYVIINVCSIIINIFYSSYMISLLEYASFKQILINLLMISITNFLFLFIRKIFEEILEGRKTILINKERLKINKILFTIKYQKLENQEFQSIHQKYTENIKRSGSTLYRLCCQFANTLKGLMLIMISIVFLIYIVNKNIINIQFTKSKLYIILIFIVIIVVLVISIVIIMSKLNKKKFKLTDKCLHYDSIFSYYYRYVTDPNKGKEIRLFNEQKIIQKKAYKELINKGTLLRKKIAKISGATGALIASIGGITCICIYSFVGLFALESKMPYENIVFLLGYLMQIIYGIMYLVEGIGKIDITTKTLPYYFNIIQFNDKETHIEYVDIPNQVDNIKFQNVTFYYPNTAKPTIDNISFCIEKNDNIALIGKNGSGKTTIIKVLCGLYTDYEGEIFINDINIKYFNPYDYKKLFSIIFQDFNLFHFKISENISTDGYPDSLRINNILKKTNILDFLKKNNVDINNYIGKEIHSTGINFSGGQKQSIAISRTLYKNSQIIIMDEPTASLDPIAEQELYDYFSQLTENRLSFFISHRLSSCKFCNKIIVLDKGRLVQIGSHKELIKQNGIYNELWNAQAKYYN